MHPLFSPSFPPTCDHSLSISLWIRYAPTLFRRIQRLYRKVRRASARVFAPPPSTRVSVLALLLMFYTIGGSGLVLCGVRWKTLMSASLSVVWAWLVFTSDVCWVAGSWSLELTLMAARELSG
ncbi:hypothetical protein DVH24_034745 [Malus domestica]|uniref:Uncharacterized protein n=1 Tax=Malus domestica TaxID=3750 RepID=A0A498IZQ6_MALDO|nr:hypothetical protein DVH24_034745 [Malus domestica]